MRPTFEMKKCNCFKRKRHIILENVYKAPIKHTHLSCGGVLMCIYLLIFFIYRFCQRLRKQSFFFFCKFFTFLPFSPPKRQKLFTQLFNCVVYTTIFKMEFKKKKKRLTALLTSFQVKNSDCVRACHYKYYVLAYWGVLECTIERCMHCTPEKRRWVMAGEKCCLNNSADIEWNSENYCIFARLCSSENIRI